MDYAILIPRPNCPAIFAAAGAPPDVAFDNSSIVDPWDSANDTTTPGTLVVGSLTNGILLAFADWEDTAAGSAAVSGISSNLGGAFTHLPSSATLALLLGQDYGADVWYLLNPAAGTHTVTLTMNETTDTKTIGLLSAQNVNQVTPFGALFTNIDASGTPTSTTVTVTDSASGDLSICHLFTGSVSLAEQENTTGTKRWESGEFGFNGATSLLTTINAVGPNSAHSFTIPARGFMTCGFALKKA